ncbi:MAG: ECF-type sigma factor [Balneolaceae bacterium]|nr:ECF-type sigma factor [Balneolaceae bacterium]
MATSSKDITAILNRLNGTNENQAEVIYPLIYNRLREIAEIHLHKERKDHTIQATELVHQAYLKMVKQDQASFNNRSHFLAIASLPCGEFW